MSHVESNVDPELYQRLSMPSSAASTVVVEATLNVSVVLPLTTQNVLGGASNGNIQLKCSGCNRTFKSRKPFLKHTTECLSRLHEPCCVCHAMIHPTLMHNHVVQVHNLTCSTCPKKFEQADAFQNHVKKCTKTPHDPCFVCQTMVHPALMHNHVIEVHKMTCSTCSRTFQYFETFQGHVKECAEIPHQPCCVCQTMVHPARMHDHVVEVHKMTCTICSKVFHHLDAFRNHLLVCESELQRGKCPVKNCTDMIVTNLESTWQHFQEKHRGTRCPVCFEDKAPEHAADLSVRAFISHIQACYKRRKGYKCDRCGADWFETNALLNKHKRNAFKCVTVTDCDTEQTFFELFESSDVLIGSLHLAPAREDETGDELTTVLPFVREIDFQLDSTGFVEPVDTVTTCLPLLFIDGIYTKEEDCFVELELFHTRLRGLEFFDKSPFVFYAFLVFKLFGALQAVQHLEKKEASEFCNNLLGVAELPLAVDEEMALQLRSTMYARQFGKHVADRIADKEHIYKIYYTSAESFEIPIHRLVRQVQLCANQCATHDQCCHKSETHRCRRKVRTISRHCLPLYRAAPFSLNERQERVDMVHEECVYLFVRDVFCKATEHFSALRVHHLMARSQYGNGVSKLLRMLQTKAIDDGHVNAPLVRAMLGVK